VQGEPCTSPAKSKKNRVRTSCGLKNQKNQNQKNQKEKPKKTKKKTAKAKKPKSKS